MDHGAVAGLAALVFLGVLAWRGRRRFRLAGYGFFVFLAMMAPTSSILPIRDPVAEHRLYFSMIGLLLIAVDILNRFHWRRVWAFTAVDLNTSQPALAVAEYRRALALEPTLAEAAWELSEATSRLDANH